MSAEAFSDLVRGLLAEETAARDAASAGMERHIVPPKVTLSRESEETRQALIEKHRQRYLVHAGRVAFLAIALDCIQPGPAGRGEVIDRATLRSSLRLHVNPGLSDAL